jgi:hypothetical protein
MACLAGNDFQMPGRKGVSVFGGTLALAFVMAVLAGIHGMIQVGSNRLLDCIPFCKIVILITRMAGDASEAFGVMDIGFCAPLTTSSFSVGDRMTGPTILVRRAFDNLNVEIFKISHFFFRVIRCDLIHS